MSVKATQSSDAEVKTIATNSTGVQTKSKSEKAGEILTAYYQGLLEGPKAVCNEVATEGKALYNIAISLWNGEHDKAKKHFNNELDRTIAPFRNIYNKLVNK